MALFGILLGFAGFVSSIFGLIWRGFDREGRRQPAFWPMLLVLVVFLALFIFSLPRYPAPYPY